MVILRKVKVFYEPRSGFWSSKYCPVFASMYPSREKTKNPRQLSRGFGEKGGGATAAELPRQSIGAPRRKGEARELVPRPFGRLSQHRFGCFGRDENRTVTSGAELLGEDDFARNRRGLAPTDDEVDGAAGTFHAVNGVGEIADGVRLALADGDAEGLGGGGEGGTGELTEGGDDECFFHNVFVFRFYFVVFVFGRRCLQRLRFCQNLFICPQLFYFSSNFFSSELGFVVT